MLKLSQLDKRWGKQRLGGSKLTVNDYGCTTTGISMISDDFGCYKSPLEIARVVSNYTPSGLVLWNALNNFFAGQMRFVWRGYGYKGHGYISKVTDFSRVFDALNNPKMRVIFEVKDGKHWVKVLSKDEVGADWQCIDPLGGRDVAVLKTYKNITGYAIFEDLKDSPAPTPPVDESGVALGKRMAGKLLICPDMRGRLFYVNNDGKLTDLGPDPVAVRDTVGNLAHGISGADVNKIPRA